MQTDLFTVMQAVRNETLSDIDVEFYNKSACCVIVASGGYPESYKKGCDVTLKDIEGVTVYHAGTAVKDGKLVTSGGRVAGITAVGDTLEQAIDAAYSGIPAISFEGMFYRNDIGQKALKLKER
jgi:phosphoribosylamine--glycine ligase